MDNWRCDGQTLYRSYSDGRLSVVTACSMDFSSCRVQLVDKAQQHQAVNSYEMADCIGCSFISGMRVLLIALHSVVILSIHLEGEGQMLSYTTVLITCQSRHPSRIKRAKSKS